MICVKSAVVRRAFLDARQTRPAVRIAVLQSPIGRANGAIPRRADRHAMHAWSTAARSDVAQFDRLNGSLEWSGYLPWPGRAPSRFGTTATRLKFFHIAGAFPTITACIENRLCRQIQRTAAYNVHRSLGQNIATGGCGSKAAIRQKIKFQACQQSPARP